MGRRGGTGHNARRAGVSAGADGEPTPVGGAEWVSVLQADPELAARLPDATVAEALPFAVAQARWLDVGEWHPEYDVGEDPGGRLGLLVIEGFLARRVQVLDRPSAALLARAVSRSRAAALTLAIGQLVGVELRLLVLLWHIAERWSAREPEGTVLPVHLTHELLASLISAQRATVTRGLRALTEEGRVSRAADGRLVLHGGPPAQFRRLQSELG